MPANKLPHTESVERLARQLRRHVDEDAVAIYTANFGLVIHVQPLTCRVPDLAMFVRANMVVRDGYIHSAPELAVEVLSPGNTRREREDKLRDYESISVPEVWVLSPEAKTLELLQLVEGHLVTIAIRNRGQITPKLFPYAPIDIEAIWP